MRVRVRPKIALIAIATSVVAVSIGPATASARITPIPKRTSATAVARAMMTNTRQLRRAFFSVVGPRGNPAAVSTSHLAGFGRGRARYAMLSNGNTLFADDRNRSGSTTAANLGPLIRGARDVLIMRMDLRVPHGANCLSFRFRFLSEEFPEFVNDEFNDAFIAELDQSTWDASGPADPAIIAPNNFARSANGSPIRVNTIGDTAVSPRHSKGTTYDAATRLLRASTPITAGRHVLYLSIFDQGDRGYDSTVFIDRLTLDRRSPCESGVGVL